MEDEGLSGRPLHLGEEGDALDVGAERPPLVVAPRSTMSRQTAISVDRQGRGPGRRGRDGEEGRETEEKEELHHVRGPAS